jgi:hypothetical protein
VTIADSACAVPAGSASRPTATAAAATWTDKAARRAIAFLGVRDVFDMLEACRAAGGASLEVVWRSGGDWRRSALAAADPQRLDRRLDARDGRLPVAGYELLQRPGDVRTHDPGRQGFLGDDDAVHHVSGM